MDELIAKLIDKRQIKKEKIGFDQISKHIDRAFLDLKAAEGNFQIDYVISYGCSYSAMLKSGRALMFLFGYRPADGQQHKTVVLFCERVLGENFSKLVAKFDNMRNLRNKFTYDEPGIQVSEQEAKQAFTSAKEFVAAIYDFVEKKNPQIKLLKNN